MDIIQKSLLQQIAGLHEVPEGAYNIRATENSTAVIRRQILISLQKKINRGLILSLNRIQRTRVCIFRYC